MFQIPIYSGCETAFAVPFKVENDDDFTCNNNGNDGFGDTNLPNINVQIQDEHAVNAIVRLAEFHKGGSYFLCNSYAISISNIY